ncbi:hypothetical protein F2Q69_00011332 [Brassica cretica]|uniref:DUF629 domain-containing protein n=1 Tax=Brassica cretica TaxID=69181 RepID=A0A8S9QT41_BRACR|nr:hypothetical protein F2Q69_00011332 [Brassica cretica]
METTFYSPERRENPEEDCDSWKIVDAYTQAEVFLHEGDYVKVLEITEATISVHGANPSCYRHHLLQGDSMMDSKLCTCLKPNCTWHILETHVQKFQPRSSSRPRRLDECFASMIRCGNWEPVDTAEAINLIKDKIERKERLGLVDGLCRGECETA